MQATFRAGYTYKPWNVNGWYRMRLFKGGKSNLETARNSGEYKQLGGFATHTLVSRGNLRSRIGPISR